MCPVGGGARLAVAAASGVLTVCVAGAPLYVSSVGSESVQLQLSHMCLADAGLYMYLGQAGTLTFGGKPIELVEDQLETIISELDHAQPPVVTTQTGPLVHSRSTDEPSARWQLRSRWRATSRVDTQLRARPSSPSTT